MHFLEKPCVAAARASLLSDWVLGWSEMGWSPERTRPLDLHRCLQELWPQQLLGACSAPWLPAPLLAFQ